MGGGQSSAAMWGCSLTRGRGMSEGGGDSQELELGAGSVGDRRRRGQRALSKG